MKSLALAGIAALALTGAAHASVIPVLDNVTPDGSNFTFNYTGQLAGDQGVTDGSQLVILDFAGYVDGSVHSSLPNVSATVSNTLPAGLVPYLGVVDNPSIPDLVFTYTGPDYQTSGGPFPGLTNFSGLSADSIFGGTMIGSFSAAAIKNNGIATGTVALNQGLLGVPTSAVPEPASWALMIIGFLGLGTALRVNRARSIGATAQA